MGTGWVAVGRVCGGWVGAWVCGSQRSSVHGHAAAAHDHAPAARDVRLLGALCRDYGKLLESKGERPVTVRRCETVEEVLKEADVSISGSSLGALRIVLGAIGILLGALRGSVGCPGGLLWRSWGFCWVAYVLRVPARAAGLRNGMRSATLAAARRGVAAHLNYAAGPLPQPPPPPPTPPSPPHPHAHASTPPTHHHPARW